MKPDLPPLDNETWRLVVEDVLTEFARVVVLQGEHDRRDGTSRHDYGNQAEQAAFSVRRARGKTKLTWRHLLTELYWAALAETSDKALRERLLRLAALALLWASAIDRRAAKTNPLVATPQASGAPSPAPEHPHLAEREPS
jgi:hypothetical protein